MSERKLPRKQGASPPARQEPARARAVQEEEECRLDRLKKTRPFDIAFQGEGLLLACTLGEDPRGGITKLDPTSTQILDPTSRRKRAAQGRLGPGTERFDVERSTIRWRKPVRRPEKAQKVCYVSVDKPTIGGDVFGFHSPSELFQISDFRFHQKGPSLLACDFYTLAFCCCREKIRSARSIDLTRIRCILHKCQSG